MNVDELRKEFERLRAELTAAGDGDTWREACGRLEKELEKTRAELAAAKAASIPPVKINTCWFTLMFDYLGFDIEDSLKFNKWMKERMKGVRGE
jgi:hypothetical protein